MKLVEQAITAIFNGVSRQTPTVRLQGQVQEADNALPSVVTGGMEKRPGTEAVASMGFLDVATSVQLVFKWYAGTEERRGPYNTRNEALAAYPNATPYHMAEVPQGYPLPYNTIDAVTAARFGDGMRPWYGAGAGVVGFDIDTVVKGHAVTQAGTTDVETVYWGVRSESEAPAPYSAKFTYWFPSWGSDNLGNVDPYWPASPGRSVIAGGAAQDSTTSGIWTMRRYITDGTGTFPVDRWYVTYRYSCSDSTFTTWASGNGFTYPFKALSEARRAARLYLVSLGGGGAAYSVGATTYSNGTWVDCIDGSTASVTLTRTGGSGPTSQTFTFTFVARVPGGYTYDSATGGCYLTNYLGTDNYQRAYIAGNASTRDAFVVEAQYYYWDGARHWFRSPSTAALAARHAAAAGTPYYGAYNDEVYWVGAPSNTFSAKRYVSASIGWEFNMAGPTISGGIQPGAPGSTTNYALHLIERDQSEKYGVVVRNDGSVSVFSLLDGTQRTVITTDAVKSYLTAGDVNDLGFVTVADYTFLINKKRTVALAPAAAPTEAQKNNVGYLYFSGWIDSGQLGFTVVISGGAAVTWVPAAAGGTDNAINAGITALSAVYTPAAGYTFSKISATVMKVVKTGAEMTSLAISDSYGGQYSEAILHACPTKDALPGAIDELDYQVKIGSNATAGQRGFYLRFNGSSWVEATVPGVPSAFDAGTMPVKMVRNADGTFTLSQVAWAQRTSGDDTSCPPPAFVGRTINDITFHRGRLVLLADETVTYSQSGDALNFWPENAYQELASDPIRLSASTNKVTVLKHAVPFRKALFTTGTNTQFEVNTPDILTSKNAALDVTTSYACDVVAKPTLMGDVLYFASMSQGNGVVYEYTYSDATLSNQAADVTKHVEGFIPLNVQKLSAASVAQRLFLLPTAQRNHIYMYSSHWQGSEKVMSSWTRYVLGVDTNACYVYGMAATEDYLYLLTYRNGNTMLERMPVVRESVNATLGFAPLLDRRVYVAGVHSGGYTTWTLPYAHASAVQVLLATGGEAGRWFATPSYPTGTTVRVPGNYDGIYAYIGLPYTFNLELSPQYYREQTEPDVFARVQLNHLWIRCRDTGYFEVNVTPKLRAAKTWKYTGNLLGASASPYGVPAIVPDAEFKVRVNSAGETVKLAISNNTPYPSVIAQARWTGLATDHNRDR
jgi:hypothetical protein